MAPGARAIEAYALLAATALFWAGNSVIARALHAELPPVTTAFLRWALAAAIVLPFAAARLRRQWQTVRDHWRALVALGLFGVAGFNTLLYAALQTTTATTAVLVNAMIPALILLLGRAAFGTAIVARQTVGVALAFAGVIWLVARGEWAVLAGLTFNPGDLWLLAAALVWAIYTVLLRFRPAGLDALAFLAATMVVGVVALAPLAAWENAVRPFGTPRPQVVAALVYFAVLPSVAAYLFWNRGVALIGANRAGMFLYLIPVFGIALAWYFLGETLAAYHVAGAALVLGGVYLATGGGGAQREKQG